MELLDLWVLTETRHKINNIQFTWALKPASTPPRGRAWEPTGLLLGRLDEAKAETSRSGLSLDVLTYSSNALPARDSRLTALYTTAPAYFDRKEQRTGNKSTIAKADEPARTQSVDTHSPYYEPLIYPTPPTTLPLHYRVPKREPARQA